ncbi:nucleoside/nucleotide kinase family protein [Plantibacter sp. YIM 135347]|uniref:nucleoside/nucleotide kinase family protein n=1 Tax=Plantibacter sp. YIM 135347 TaxID=3423919 RepID=UPI003D3454F1
MTELTVAELVARVAGLAEDRVGRDADGRVIVGIVGAPGSGKSTLAELLVAALRESIGSDDAVALVPMDGFHYAQVQLDALGRSARKGAPDTFDAAGFTALLQRIRDGFAPGEGRVVGLAGDGSAGTAGDAHAAPDAADGLAPDTADGLGRDAADGLAPDAVPDVYAPRFERSIEEPIAGAVRIAAEARVVIVEGNYLLLERDGWGDAAALLDEAWFLRVPQDVRIPRLVARHMLFGRSQADAEAWAAEVDEPNARVIEASAVRADLVVELVERLV